MTTRAITLVSWALFTLPALAGESRAIASLSWMAGAWAHDSGRSVVEEVWMAPAGGTMIGAGRTVGGGTTKFFEFLRIEQRGESLVYVAMPRGKGTTEFAMSSIDATSVTFENPKHDFPQSIRYWRDGERLCARVAGEGQPAEEWCYEPVRPRP